MSEETFVLTREIVPPREDPSDFFDLTFRFEPHSAQIGDEEQVKERLGNQLRGLFKKGQKNIFLVEKDVGEDEQYEISFQNGFRRYRSFAMAYVYPYCFGNRTDPEYLSNLIQNFKVSSPSACYALFTLETLDQLCSEGYNIAVEIEDTTPNLQIQSTSQFKDLAQEVGIHEAIKILLHDAQRRNETIKNQVGSLVENITRTKPETNIFVLLGTMHGGIVEILPTAIRSKTTLSSYLNPANSEEQTFNKAASKLLTDGELTDSEWNTLEKHLEVNET